MRTDACRCAETIRHAGGPTRQAICPHCRTIWRRLDGGQWIRTGHLNTNGRPVRRRRLYLVA